MSNASTSRPHQNRRVSRRVFLHSTSVIPAALASPELLRPVATVTTTCADFDVAADEPCESHLPIVVGVPLQPFVAQVTRLMAAAEYLGTPLPPDHQRELEAAFKMNNEESAVTSIQRVLDCHCLVGVEINPEMRVKVAPGPARPELVEPGWRQFLVKVHNQAGTTAVLRGISSQARRLAGAMPDELRNLWLDLQMFDSQPLTRTLSGLVLEYRIVTLRVGAERLVPHAERGFPYTYQWRNGFPVCLWREGGARAFVREARWRTRLCRLL